MKYLDIADDTSGHPVTQLYNIPEDFYPIALALTHSPQDLCNAILGRYIFTVIYLNIKKTCLVYCSTCIV